jgi:hypothetical protein
MISAAEFRQLLESPDDEKLLDYALRDDITPFVFGSRGDNWDDFRSEIADELSIQATDVRVVGSARLGFSLKPGTNLRKYDDASDVDLIVINANLFDYLWIALLEAVYPRHPATELVGGWLRQRRDEIYTGWISPLEIRVDRSIFGAKAEPVLSFNARWFRLLKRSSKFIIRRHEDVSGRLYRTMEHANLYHLNSLAALRRSLLPE